MRIRTYSVEIKDLLNVLVADGLFKYEKFTNYNSPENIVTMMNEVFHLNRKAEEHMYLLAMNTKCRLIGVFLLSKGTVNGSLVSPREVFVRLCLCGASGFIMVHNHPSGDPAPSSEDFDVTERVKKCAELMNIELLDHIIVGETYYSFRENFKL